MKTLALYSILIFSCVTAYSQTTTFMKNKEFAIGHQNNGEYFTQLTYLKTVGEITPDLLEQAAGMMEEKLGYIELRRVNNKQLAVLHESYISTEHILLLLSISGMEFTAISSTEIRLN